MFLSLRRRTKISSVHPGDTVTIVGTVRADRESTLPGDGTPCVYYELMTEVYRKGDRGSGRPLWFPEKMERKCNGFFLCDGTGEIFVECPADQVRMSGGHSTAGLLDKKGRRRFSARSILEGDKVRVRGIAAPPSASNGPETLCLGPDKKGKMEMAVFPGTSTDS